MTAALLSSIMREGTPAKLDLGKLTRFRIRADICYMQQPWLR